LHHSIYADPLGLLGLINTNTRAVTHVKQVQTQPTAIGAPVQVDSDQDSAERMRIIVFYIMSARVKYELRIVN
jgi:hypothetical protein